MIHGAFWKLMEVQGSWIGDVSYEKDENGIQASHSK